MKISCSVRILNWWPGLSNVSSILLQLLVLTLLGSSYAQYQYPGAGAVGTGAGAAGLGASASSVGSAGGVDNRILGLGGLLGGAGGGGGGGPFGGLFSNLLGGFLGGGNNARPAFGQSYPPAEEQELVVPQDTALDSQLHSHLQTFCHRQNHVPG